MRKITFAFIFFFLLFASLSLGQIRSVSLVKDPVFGTDKNVLLISIGTLYSDYAKFGTISASTSELEQMEPSNAKILNPFTLRWKTVDEYTLYPLTFKQQLNYIDIREAGWNWLSYSEDEVDKWVYNNCDDLDGDGRITYQVTTNIFGDVMDIFCAKNNGHFGDVYIIGSPEPYWKTQFEITNGQEVLTDYLESGKAYSKNIQNKVYIRFDSLGLFTYPKQPVNLYYFRTPGPTVIQSVFDSDKLANIVTALKDDAISYVQKVASGTMSEWEAEDAINSQIAKVTEWTTNPDFSRDKVIPLYSAGRMFLKWITTERISFENFVVYANANFIQIIIPYGQPTIVRMYSDFGDELTATTGGKITAEIRNDGNYRSTFEAVLSCEKSTVFESGKMIPDIEKGETRKVTWYINAPQIEGSDTCTLRVCDTFKTENCDTDSVGFTIKPRFVCTPGDQYVEYKDGEYIIKECGADGQWHESFRCPKGQIPEQDELGRYIGCRSAGCVSDADCPPGYVCVDGKCVIRKECVTDADCPFGFKCVDGKCVQAVECIRDEDCSYGYICVEGKCVPKPTPPPTIEWEKYLPYIVLALSVGIFGYMAWLRRKR